MAAGTAPAIEAEHLCVSRGSTQILHDLSFQIEPGRVSGLIGPSGGGKTTLMRAIVGVQANVSGRLQVLGMEAGRPALRHRVGYLTQAPSVYSDLTVSENLQYFAAIRGLARAEVRTALERVRLSRMAGRLVRRLSGGELARVSLATALLGDPELLVLDEPTVGLDPLLRDELWELFAALADAGATLLVSSHVMDEARRCEEIMLLRDGALIARESPAALTQRMGTHDLDEAFLRLVRTQAPLPDARTQEAIGV
jgi:ABC-2 type transport system ATP-binding protein